MLLSLLLQTDNLLYVFILRHALTFLLYIWICTCNYLFFHFAPSCMRQKIMVRGGKKKRSLAQRTQRIDVRLALLDDISVDDSRTKVKLELSTHT